MTDYAEFPKVMVHPHQRRAETHGVIGTEIRDALGRPIPGMFSQYTGTADQFPPVTVNNEEQEAFHHAQGYRPGGKSAPADFANMQAGPAAAPYIPERYPMWVGDTLVNDAAQEAAARRMLLGDTETPAEASPAPSRPRHTPGGHKAPKKARSPAQMAHAAKLGQMAKERAQKAL